MQRYRLGDDNFLMCTTYCNDHDWGANVSYDLENLFKPRDEYDIDNSVCNNTESGFGRVTTLGNNDPTTLEYDQSYEILEECKLCMHVDHEENILYDSYVVEFDYDPTFNYYKRGKYGCKKISCY